MIFTANSAMRLSLFFISSIQPVVNHGKIASCEKISGVKRTLVFYAVTHCEEKSSK